MESNKKFKWEKSPSWAKYAARDSDGFAIWFEHLPYPSLSNPFRMQWIVDPQYNHFSDSNPFYGTINIFEALLSLESRDDEIDPKDPLSIYIGKEMYVIRPEKGDVRVSLFHNKEDKTYSYINLTKKHICSCKFPSIVEALIDLSKYVDKGVVDFYSIDNT